MFRFTALLLIATTLLSLMLSAVRCRSGCGEPHAHIHMQIVDTDDSKPVRCRCGVHSKVTESVTSGFPVGQMTRAASQERSETTLLLPALEGTFSVRSGEELKGVAWKLLSASLLTSSVNYYPLGLNLSTCRIKDQVTNLSEPSLFLRHCALLI